VALARIGAPDGYSAYSAARHGRRGLSAAFAIWLGVAIAVGDQQR
jgi:hypothetical protein